MILSFTLTKPKEINLSASLLEQMPELEMNLFNLIFLISLSQNQYFINLAPLLPIDIMYIPEASLFNLIFFEFEFSDRVIF